MASTLCVADTAVLSNLAAGLDDGPTRQALETAVAALEGPQTEHLQWAADTRMRMALGQARGELMAKGAMATETLGANRAGLAQTSARARSSRFRRGVSG